MSNLPIFRPSFGNRPDQLVGRDETLQEILDGLKSYPGSAERATLLIGQRGMGKTAMLLEIAERAQELDYVVARTTCGDAMVDNLIEVLQRAGSQFVKEDKKPIKGFTAGALGFSVGLTFTDDVQRSFGFRVKLEMICERLAQAERALARRRGRPVNRADAESRHDLPGACRRRGRYCHDYGRFAQRRLEHPQL